MTRGSITTEPPRVEGSDDRLPQAANDVGMGEVGLPGFLGTAAQLGEQGGVRNMGEVDLMELVCFLGWLLDDFSEEIQLVFGLGRLKALEKGVEAGGHSNRQ